MSANGGFEKEWRHFYAKPSEKIAKKDGHYRRGSGLFRRKIVFSVINLIILCISGSRTVANNEKIMIRSASESIGTSELLTNV